MAAYIYKNPYGGYKIIHSCKVKSARHYPFVIILAFTLGFMFAKSFSSFNKKTDTRTEVAVCTRN